MATKTLNVIRPGLYGTRMLKAGDSFEATGPEARLFVKLGWMGEGRVASVPAKPVVKAAAKPAPRKRAKKKAAAKK